MKKRLRSKTVSFLAAITALALFVSACGASDSGTSSPGDNVPVLPDMSDDITINSSSQPTDGKITLCYNSDRSLDPITGTDSYNMAVASLMFESLFTLDNDLLPVNQLCESLTTYDGVEFDITIRQDARMTDGDSLTAWDVEYSYSRARESEKYSYQLSPISSMYASDDYTLKLVLSDTNYSIASLLTIPIVKNGTGGDSVVGSGPYRLVQDGNGARLTTSSYHRDADKLAISTIYLNEFTTTTITESIGNGSLDLIWNDPFASEGISPRGNYEARFYNTSSFQFLGFNPSNVALSDPNVRRAIGYAVDRATIVDDIYSGHALSAPLALSPALPYYNRQWETGKTFSMPLFHSNLAEAGLLDSNGDGYLDYKGTDNLYESFQLRFLVNADNSYKVDAAKLITKNLQSAGLNVTLSVLDWSDFIDAIDSGEYDIYYGETVLPTDFDLTVLLGGRLDYGGFDSDELNSLLTDFLSAHEEPTPLPGSVTDTASPTDTDAADNTDATEEDTGLDNGYDDGDSTDDEENMDDEDSEDSNDEPTEPPLSITTDITSGSSKASSAKALCDYIAQQAPIVPILYRQYAIYAGRNTVTGLSPTVSGVFTNVADWKVAG